MPRAPSSNSLDARLMRKVKACPPGSVFTPRDFVILGNPRNVAKGLERLVKRKVLRRLSRGLYDLPKYDAVLGTLWPTTDAVIKAITEKDKIRVQPFGLYAANLLGLSEQVPMKIVLLTDGATRTVKAGPMRITLKRTTPRNMAMANTLLGLIVHAFKSFGTTYLEPWHVERLRKNIPKQERLKLIQDLDLAPAWMRPWLLAVAEQGPMPKPNKHLDPEGLGFV